MASWQTPVCLCLGKHHYLSYFSISLPSCGCVAHIWLPENKREEKEGRKGEMRCVARKLVRIWKQTNFNSSLPPLWKLFPRFPKREETKKKEDFFLKKTLPPRIYGNNNAGSISFSPLSIRAGKQYFLIKELEQEGNGMRYVSKIGKRGCNCFSVSISTNCI